MNHKTPQPTTFERKQKANSSLATLKFLTLTYPSKYNVLKWSDTLKFLLQMLQDFKCAPGHFMTLCIQVFSSS